MMMAFLTHPVLLLTVGGALGTNARYGVGDFVVARSREWFGSDYSNLSAPLAILLINATGSLLLGLLIVPLRDRMPSNQHQWWLLLGVGFCRGDTSFSAFAVDAVELMRKYHQPGMALLNVALNVVASCLVAWCAIGIM